MVMLVEALGAVGDSEAAGPLLERLHSGQSLRLQVAVAQALRDLGTLETAQALCVRAGEIRQPLLHAIAVEALAGAYGLPGEPLPSSAGPRLLEQAQLAWNDRNPWALRLRVVRALQAVALDAPETWRDLAGLVDAALAEKRSPSAWSPDEWREVQAAAREFTRKAGG
jgi:hypothetical protein